MGIVDELRGLSSAEDFFHRLGVAYDPTVLGPARLHILRRMGQSLGQASLQGLGEEEALAVCRAALESAYAAFVTSTPLQERLFKVHRNARRQLLFARPGKPA
jgi:nitrogenase-stabilizing/protective protein